MIALTEKRLLTRLIFYALTGRGRSVRFYDPIIMASRGVFASKKSNLLVKGIDTSDEITPARYWYSEQAGGAGMHRRLQLQVDGKGRQAAEAEKTTG